MRMFLNLYLARRGLPSFALLLLLAAPLAACSGASGGSPAVSVTANDFSYQVNQTHLAAGKVHFTLKNNSKTYQHELWVYPQTQPKLSDMLAQKDTGADVTEADFLQGVAGKVEDLDPGKTASFDANLPPGTYDFACFIVSNIGGKNVVHYELGMHGTLTVP
jgi:uncharacterized cupredoxin-like copper-binding protein